MFPPGPEAVMSGGGDAWRADVRFERLAAGYNFRLGSPFPTVFANLVLDEAGRRDRPVRALDIGCGRGIGGNAEYQAAIAAAVDELWGIEPDETATPAPGLFARHEHALMETADLPAASFDLAYSCMVMEHVADPDAFLAAVFRCLKPGGTYLFMTPNKRHYFTRTAATLHALRLDERVLRIIKPRELVDEYHHPVQYRFNTERRITAGARGAGFAEPEFAYLEQEGARGYLPGPLRPIYHLLVLKRKLYRNPRALITLICRMTKPT